ncbi:MAG TPA: acetylxylan esterase [Anaerolineales bacterium]|nr:acetylxylan esterase [Anaerolineales bacterium]
MIYSPSLFYRKGFLFITLLLVCSLISCQGNVTSLPPQPTAAPSTPTNAVTPKLPSNITSTAIPTTALRDAPAMPAMTALPPVEDEILRLFDYDQQIPLDIKVDSEIQLDGYLSQEITYASPKGGRVTATVHIPTGSSGPFAGIILMHGMPGNRGDNAMFARGLVATGAVILRIDAPYARPENRSRLGWPQTFDEVDRLEQIQLMVDLRRGVDLLSAREDVDPERLAYVGYSYGGAMGGLLAGIEPRIKAYGLMVGDGGLVSHFINADGTPLKELTNVSDEKRQAWLELMTPIEPIRFVSRAAPSHLFFQNALRDEAVARDDALAYQTAGSEPKKIEWYESNHGLPDEAFQHMVDWLGTEIGIDTSQYTNP